MRQTVSRSVILSIAAVLVLAMSAILNPSPVHAQGMTVSIQNFAFQPATLSVPVGTTVTWTNNDMVAHTSTSDSGVWNSGTLAPGQSYSYTFTQAGSFPYHCMIHPFMHGAIVVGSVATPSPSTPTVSVTPSTVTVGSIATVQGAGFTPHNWAFVSWQRPDRTTKGVWVFTSSSGTFALRLGLNPRHGTGIEFVSAFDLATRMWAPSVSVNVTGSVVVGPGQLFASPNPVANGRTARIVGRGFVPGSLVLVQWRRPDGTMASLRIVTNGAGSFAFTLVADPRHGCGPRVFTAFDAGQGMSTTPLVLNEVC
jgi:plastocyanin